MTDSRKKKETRTLIPYITFCLRCRCLFSSMDGTTWLYAKGAVSRLLKQPKRRLSKPVGTYSHWFARLWQWGADTPAGRIYRDIIEKWPAARGMSTRHYRKEVLKKSRRVGQWVLSGCARVKVLVHAKQWVQEGPWLSNEQKHLIPVLLFSHFCVSHFGIVCLERVIWGACYKACQRVLLLCFRTLFFRQGRVDLYAIPEGEELLNWAKKGANCGVVETTNVALSL